MEAKHHIQNYSLFGETSELADELHVESIQARSQRHNWELKPHRHPRLHQILLLTDGGGAAELDGQNHTLPPPCIVNVPRNVVHGFQFDLGTSGWVITLTSGLVDHCLTGGEGLRKPLVRACITPMPDNLRLLAQQLSTEYMSQSFGRTQALRGLSGVTLAMAARCIDLAEESSRNSRENPLFTRFETLVERDFRSRRSLADYAADLAISPTHLNRIVHAATGHSASQLVRDRVLREAKRLLTYTNMTAAGIAYELGFNDPTHFSRVFTKGTGLPPREFRRRMEVT